MLSNFCESVENILYNAEPLVDQIRQLRLLLSKFLLFDEFKLSCLDRIMSSLEKQGDALSSWHVPHLFYHEQLKFSLRIIFWPAFYENNPHQHKTWSVTGVLYNTLNINTYTLLENPSRLKKEKIIAAGKDEVGYLLPGCIHNISNSSHELSASIHIFNNLDISNPEGNAIWYPSPKKFDLLKGLVERALLLCLKIASSMQTEQAFNLINRIYQYSPVTIKLLAIQAMQVFDRAYAKQCFRAMEKFL